MNICGCKRIGLPISKDLLIKFREREKEIKITELEKQNKTFLLFYCVGIARLA